MEKSEIKELLNTLKSIDSTLKRIEQNTRPKKQQDIAYNAVSKALSGDKAKLIPIDE